MLKKCMPRSSCQDDGERSHADTKESYDVGENAGSRMSRQGDAKLMGSYSTVIRIRRYLGSLPSMPTRTSTIGTTSGYTAKRYVFRADLPSTQKAGWNHIRRPNIMNAALLGHALMWKLKWSPRRPRTLRLSEKPWYRDARGTKPPVWLISHCMVYVIECAWWLRESRRACVAWYPSQHRSGSEGEDAAASWVIAVSQMVGA